MTDIAAAIRDAFEHTMLVLDEMAEIRPDEPRALLAAVAHDLGDVAVNRQRVRVPVLREGTDPDALRAVIEEALGADAVVAFTVSTETVDGGDTIGTVASFRHRS